MRDVVSGTQIQTEARAANAPGEPDARLQMFAVYGAFALIAAILFGTLSYHPF